MLYLDTNGVVDQQKYMSAMKAMTVKYSPAVLTARSIADAAYHATFPQAIPNIAINVDDESTVHTVLKRNSIRMLTFTDVEGVAIGNQFVDPFLLFTAGKHFLTLVVRVEFCRLNSILQVWIRTFPRIPNQHVLKRDTDPDSSLRNRPLHLLSFAMNQSTFWIPQQMQSLSLKLLVILSDNHSLFSMPSELRFRLHLRSLW